MPPMGCAAGDMTRSRANVPFGTQHSSSRNPIGTARVFLAIFFGSYVAALLQTSAEHCRKYKLHMVATLIDLDFAKVATQLSPSLACYHHHTPAMHEGMKRREEYILALRNNHASESTSTATTEPSIAQD